MIRYAARVTPLSLLLGLAPPSWRGLFYLENAVAFPQSSASRSSFASFLRL